MTAIPSPVVPTVPSDLVSVETLPVPRTDIRPPTRWGYGAIIAGCGAFLVWSTQAQLHSAVVAPGVLEPVSGRKTVKHGDGGPIGAVLVQDGDTVKAGQPLIQLDDTAARSTLSALQGQYFQATALAARLQAELDGKTGPEWPKELADADDQRALSARNDQQILFVTRAAQFSNDLDLSKERIRSLQAQELALRGQRDTFNTLIRLSDKNLSRQAFLRTKGLERTPQTAEYEMQKAENEGHAAALDSEIYKTRQMTFEAQAEIPKKTADHRQQIATDLVKARGDVAVLRDQMMDARNKLALRTIAAPTGGVVVIGAHHIAPGVVITANDPVLDIVPADDPLVVEARVQTKDVKDLVPGLTTRLVLSAYDSRVLGTLGGTVEYVSADRMTDPANPQQPPYYLAKIKLDRATPKQIDVGNGHLLPIRAGMPVEVRIQVAGRTPIDYIVGPITQSYLKAFIQ